MIEASKAGDVDETRIVLGLLEYVGRGGEQSQRRLASELGVALGLANAYLKRCVKKGLVKVRQAPARRYAYYLTPRGLCREVAAHAGIHVVFVRPVPAGEGRLHGRP
jgi:DNA-binding MarR family transcriptional regulator